MLIYIQLVKAGYGTLNEVKQMSAREVLQAVYYEEFIGDYENALFEIGRNA